MTSARAARRGGKGPRIVFFGRPYFPRTFWIGGDKVYAEFDPRHRYRDSLPRRAGRLTVTCGSLCISARAYMIEVKPLEFDDADRRSIWNPLMVAQEAPRGGFRITWQLTDWIPR